MTDVDDLAATIRAALNPLFVEGDEVKELVRRANVSLDALVAEARRADEWKRRAEEAIKERDDAITMDYGVLLGQKRAAEAERDRLRALVSEGHKIAGHICSTLDNPRMDGSHVPVARDAAYELKAVLRAALSNPTATTEEDE